MVMSWSLSRHSCRRRCRCAVLFGHGINAKVQNILNFGALQVQGLTAARLPKLQKEQVSRGLAEWAVIIQCLRERKCRDLDVVHQQGPSAHAIVFVQAADKSRGSAARQTKGHPDQPGKNRIQLSDVSIRECTSRESISDSRAYHALYVLKYIHSSSSAWATEPMPAERPLSLWRRS